MDWFAGKGPPGDWGLGPPGDWGLGPPGDWGLGPPGDWGPAGESLGRAVQAARDAFGPDWEPDGVAIAPGRIELLGNHVDYNGGPVLAAAIDRFIVVAIAQEPGGEQTVRAVAADAPDEAMATLDAGALAGWTNTSP